MICFRRTNKITAILRFQPQTSGKNILYSQEKEKDMLEAPIAEGAEIFIWIVCIGAGFVAGLIAIDTYKPKKKEKDS